MCSPFFFQVNKYPLMVIPDVQFHLDGTASLTFIYNIYLDCGMGNPGQRIKKDLALKSDKQSDPDYFGYVVFHKNETIFTYVPDGENRLREPEVEQLIDMVSQVRNQPDLWQKFRNN